MLNPLAIDRLRDFRPHRLFRGGHAQTIFAAYARTLGYPYSALQQIVELEDGDRVVLHDDTPDDWKSGDRVALLVHGLTGCHGSSYLVRTAGKLNRRGIRTFRLDLRGNGASQSISFRPGHAGRSGDVLAAVNAIVRACPTSPLCVVGFSLGGNLVLKMLGENPEAIPAQLDMAMAVAPPIDLHQCASALEQGTRRLYSRAFTRRLLRLVKARPDLIDEIPDAFRRPPKGLLEFDDRVTAPLSGFRDAADYYQQSSSAPLLRRIQVPTIVVTAADDPLIAVEMFRPDFFTATTQLVVVPGGGHVGFYARKGADLDRWWLDWRVVEWVTGRLATRV